MKVHKAIIPAAGLGTRFLPATKAQPKEMLPIVDKPTIQFIVEEAVASGIEDIIIVTGRGKRAIEDHFDKSYELEEELKRTHKEDLLALVRDISNMVNIHYIRQKEPRGLGHAVYCAKSFIGNEPFAVLLGDDIVKSEIPCLKQLIDVFDEYHTTVLGVQRVPQSEVSKYGIVAGRQVDDRVIKVTEMIEKPEIDEAPSDIAILGRYILSPSIFKYLENTPPGKGGEIQLTDAIREMMHHEAIYAYEFIGKRYDVGNKLGFLQATVEFALERDDLKEEFRTWLEEILKQK
ncbi:UTP--glucose-1-phosphate uridylyltransferase GtaB [Thermoclostridium stercorarium subsp. stercorarium DSM 8532]|jgi:UTP--glucose-1-phosphate uridylyltransferase|uniref:UTP--glucose-1-phosphate uridylyltransferase n=3 Tax=Thermoclostridium stercorarium TaxID=1510 RepID=L7VKS6_THES1|nr:UTP--glucose-1-phosphate uridylyltransferase GalU [Thermoclostridium stercorarium]AGC67352.1 UTP--glucose-1-phosphate uridylyltransferase GtaB [Thermoclostridium stercorarium subsp. stercorarium DSM 8532]AGI38413.1 UDP-glucose pyrophosphorylase [Thermoclostridium stercorarium subsp. stercorarium DSM 8532]ANW97846.1 UTP--glucose-1-phosphate uridylyltransferase [Thermoclostridium stercorarium subsp. thermolacticum DSM 2910]ANX00398.1 UTP--glucose-1-phosphate uridylyltransferase [Thermoclostrid